MQKNKIVIPIVTILCVLSVACKKNWLDAKPQLSLVVPSTIADYQALLDNTNSTSSTTFNATYNISDEISAADFYISDLLPIPPYQQNEYKWTPDIYGSLQLTDPEWNLPYGRIFYCNIVLEGIEKIIPQNVSETTAWNQVKGSALFFRAYSHYDIARLFCKEYDKNTANTDWGIPLRLESDINKKSVRSSVLQSYLQIISDLKDASLLLPVSTPINVLYRCRPTKCAAYGMLARIYLSMSEYDSAFVYADKSLQLYSTLLDFNSTKTTATVDSIAPASNTPFARLNNEVVFHMRANSYSALLPSRLFIDSVLYNSYNGNDLRRTVYFRLVSGNIYTFKGSYDGSTTLFNGLATDELYFTRAECYARKTNTIAALQDLNTVMQKRWKNSAWVPFTATDANDALKQILIERRKELCFRGLRWNDLKRLNKDSRFAVSLKRIDNGQTYILPPNSPLYIFPIPPDVISLSGIQQNPR